MQTEDGIRERVRAGGLGEVYKRQADTSNGRVTVNGVDTGKIKQHKKSEATVTLGDGDASVIDTSNGSITIERRAE